MAIRLVSFTRLRDANFFLTGRRQIPHEVNQSPPLFSTFYLSTIGKASLSTRSSLSSLSSFLWASPLSGVQSRSLHTTQPLNFRNKKGGRGAQNISGTQTKQKQDYYAILGIEKTATDKEVRRAYLKLAKENHPDYNPGNEAAEVTFKLATEAHAVLSDSKRRSMYDKHGKEGFSEEESHRDGLMTMFGGDKFEELVGDPGPIFENIGGGDSDDECDLDRIDEDEGMSKRKVDLLEKLLHSECKDERDRLHEELNELKAAIRKDFVGRARQAADADRERREKRQKEADERIASLVDNLLYRLSMYQPNATMVAAGSLSFEEQTKRRATEIVQSPGGIGMLEMVGEMYLLEARRNFTFKDDFLGLERAKAYGSSISNRFSMVSGLLTRGMKLKKLIKEIKEESEEGNEEFMQKNRGTVVETLWMHGKLQFSGRLQKTLRTVLLDKGIDSAEKQRRAEGLRIMGQTFLEVAEETKKDRRFTDSPLNWQTNAKDTQK